MSKIVFYIIVIVCGQAVLAQKFNGFFIEPLANIKTTIFYKKDLPEAITTQYFSIKPQKNITPLGFNIGINFGYKFNNNNIIQFGFFQDESLSGIDFSGNNVISSSTIATVGGIKFAHFGGAMTKNINILFKKELINIITKKNNKEPYFSVNFNIGLTYFYKPNNGLENLTGINTLSYNSFDSSYVQFTEAVWVLPLPFRYSFKLNTGIEFTFGNKKRELFTLGISYITNLSQSNYYSFSSGDVRVTDKHNKTISYPYHVIARGNGIYYQISKRFYPFKWRHERMARKMEKLKG